MHSNVSRSSVMSATLKTHATSFSKVDDRTSRSSIMDLSCQLSVRAFDPVVKTELIEAGMSNCPEEVGCEANVICL